MGCFSSCQGCRPPVSSHNAFSPPASVLGSLLARPPRLQGLVLVLGGQERGLSKTVSAQPEAALEAAGFQTMKPCLSR